MSRVAALDLGSNTFLCLIVEKQSDGSLKVLEDQVETVRLGQELEQNKFLHPDALARAEACLEKFSNLIKSYKVDMVSAVATSAARDATNGQKLFDLGIKYDIPISIISGDREAQISFEGASFGHLKADENEVVAVIDIGGGSTEIIIGDKQNIYFAKSFDVGGVRMTERHILHQPVPELEQKKLWDDLATIFNDELEKLKKYKIKRMLAVAGTPTALAALELGGFDPVKVDGFQLDLQQLKKWQQVFAETSIQEKRDKYGLGGRADIIYAGITILIKTLEELNLGGVDVSTKGVRYGLAIDLFKSNSKERS